MSDLAAPIIRHAGGHCPVDDAEAKVIARFRNGWITNPIEAGKLRWSHKGEVGDILAWRRA